MIVRERLSFKNKLVRQSLSDDNIRHNKNSIFDVLSLKNVVDDDMDKMLYVVVLFNLFK